MAEQNTMSVFLFPCKQSIGSEPEGGCLLPIRRWRNKSHDEDTSNQRRLHACTPTRPRVLPPRRDTSKQRCRHARALFRQTLCHRDEIRASNVARCEIFTVMRRSRRDPREAHVWPAPLRRDARVVTCASLGGYPTIICEIFTMRRLRQDPVNRLANARQDTNKRPHLHHVTIRPVLPTTEMRCIRRAWCAAEMRCKQETSPISPRLMRQPRVAAKR